MKELSKIKLARSKLKILDLNNVDAYPSIWRILKEDLAQIVLPSKIINAGVNLYRCRNNFNNEIFQTIEELSFRQDIDNIKEFGRANQPNQSIFYSADIRLTAISETNKAFRGENYTDIDEISITTSHWVSIKDLKLTLIIGNKNAQEKNELIKSLNIDIKSFTKEIFKEDTDKVLEILNYISDEFAYNIKENSNYYKISCAFAQLAYESSDGILYPSLQRQFEGLNFAIKPNLVTEKLRFISAIHDKFKKVRDKQYQHFETTETVGIEGNKLIWGDTTKIASH